MDYECEKSPSGEHMQGTYYCKLSGQTEFLYTSTKDKHKGSDNFCQFSFCPFCGTKLKGENIK